MIDTAQIVGHGADADPSRRPGIPRERDPGALLASPEPRAQGDGALVLVGRADRTLTPIYGTAQPPRGLSGALRRAAYAYPAHWMRHWMMLLAADRIDVLEHRLLRPASLAAVAAGLVAGGLALGILRHRARR